MIYNPISLSKTWTRILTNTILIGSLSSLALPARAQMGLSPIVIEVAAQRNKAQGSIQIKNVKNTPLRIRLAAEPFTYDQNKGFQSLESSEQNLTPHLQFAPRELTIEPNSSRSVRFVTLFPPNLPPGEYRAIVFAEELLETDRNSEGNVSKSFFTARIGTTIYVRHGDIAPELAISQGTWNATNKKMELVVSNGGEASARPTGTWNLSQQGEEKAQGKFPATTVIAEGKRNFPVNFAENTPDLAPGQYQLTGELTWKETGSDSDKKQKLPFNVEITIPANNQPTP